MVALRPFTGEQSRLLVNLRSATKSGSMRSSSAPAWPTICVAKPLPVMNISIVFSIAAETDKAWVL